MHTIDPSRQLTRIRTVAEDGITVASNPYLRDRFETIIRAVDAVTDPVALVRHLAVVEAEAKSGVGTSCEDSEELVCFRRIKDMVQRLLGYEFFAPATRPRSPGTPLDRRHLRRAVVTPGLAVAAVVSNDKHELLLVRRTDGAGWCLPGGYADVGLSAEEVAAKEVLEETSVEVYASRLLRVCNDMDATHADGPQPTPQHTLLYLCHHISGEPQADGLECSDAEFLSLDELPPTDQLLHRGDPWIDLARRAVVAESGIVSRRVPATIAFLP